MRLDRVENNFLFGIFLNGVVDIALIKNNASIGAQAAVALAQLHRRSSGGT